MNKYQYTRINYNNNVKSICSSESFQSFHPFRSNTLYKRTRVRNSRSRRASPQERTFYEGSIIKPEPLLIETRNDKLFSTDPGRW